MKLIVTLKTVLFDHFLWSFSTVNMQVTYTKTIFKTQQNVVNKYPQGNNLTFIESDWMLCKKSSLNIQSDSIKAKLVP